VAGGALTWSDGAITAPEDRGLVLDGAVAAVTGVAFTTGGQRGLLTVQGGAELAATGVTLTGGGIGLYLGEGSATVTGGHFEGFGTSGVLSAAGTHLALLQSTFKDNAGGHVAQVGADATVLVAGCDLDGAQETCLSAGNTAGALRVLDNTIRHCRGSGISLSAATDILVSGNTIEEIRPDPIFQEVADGISLVDTTATITGNTIGKVDMRGVGIIRSAATLTDNVIGPCGDAGINALDPGADQVVVTGNTISQTVGAGVALLSAPGLIKGNTISGVYYDYSVGLGDGIVFAATDATVEDNLCEYNARAGVVFFEGATGVIGGNTLRDNAGYGIAEYCTAGDNAVTIRADNVLTGNVTDAMLLCSATVEAPAP
jgi:nitrous oxidase accessory protein NosD